MDDEYNICPMCKNGFVTNVIENMGQENQHEITYYYSCGHRFIRVSLADRFTLNEELKIKSKSIIKIKGKPIHETEEKISKSDIDCPEKVVYQSFYKCRKGFKTSVFQIVRYESGEIKHVHCKNPRCDNEWNNNSTDSLNTKFIIAISDKVKIQCVHCGAIFET